MTFGALYGEPNVGYASLDYILIDANQIMDGDHDGSENEWGKLVGINKA